MQTAVINIKVEPATKKEAQKIAEKLGLNLSAVIHGYLKQFIRTKSVQFNLEEPSEHMKQALKESKADIQADRIISFKNEVDELSYLDKLIAKDVKRSSNKKGSAQNKLFKKL